MMGAPRESARAQVSVVSMLFSFRIDSLELEQRDRRIPSDCFEFGRTHFAAIVAAVVFMFAFAGAVHGFVNRHPTIKMLALAFLLVIGVALIADGFEFHIPKGYIYSAMAFAIGVEILNIRLRRRGQPVHLHGPQLQPGAVCPTCGQPLARP